MGLLVLAACGKAPQTMPPSPLPHTPTVPPSPSPTSSPAPSAAPAQTPTPAASLTPPPLTLWISPALPIDYTRSLALPAGVVLSENQAADLRLEPGVEPALSRWIYLAVAAFPAQRSELSSAALRDMWRGETMTPLSEAPLLMTAETQQVFAAWWGAPAAGAVEILPAEGLLEAAWADRTRLALIPFEALEPRWKTLPVDGQSPLQPEFDPQQYPLAVPIGVRRQGAAVDFDPASLQLPVSNFQPEKLSRVTLTGVTALVRGTALTMLARGITYPAQDILPWLRQSDLLHINNEVPFYSQCPKPELYPAEIRFCSPPEFLELLTYIGADVIELAGDHFGDYGPAAMLETLQLYQAHGMRYYGGGANLNEARQALLLEHHGNRFAFIGCNAKGIRYYASASDTFPGAAACDFDWLLPEIARLKEAGYLVIVTFQHNEYYTYEAQPDLQRDFRRAAEAGAVIVSGSQAHQPHGMEFLDDRLIHYGLGNLFFDQFRYYPGPELDRAFIDQHYFYAGRYLGVELLTIQFTDLAHSRPQTPAERESFLEQIFAASGW